ncbi:hypothetical protein M569_10539, partial [Genlisea aurea]
NARPPLPSSCPPVLRKLIHLCWSRRPEKRPDFEEIVGFLEGYSESPEDQP